LESFSEPCAVCDSRGVIVHHEPIVRSRSNNEGKSEKKRKGHMEVANVVTPEKALEINNVMAKIAASTLGKSAEVDPDTKAAGLESILEALPEAKPDAKRKPRRASSDGAVDPEA
jgi:ribonuclease E